MNSKIKRLLEKGVQEEIYPGAVVLVGVSGRIVMHCSAGYSQKTPFLIPMKKDTIFDLASLTKPLATTLAIMKIVDDRLIDLDIPISKLMQVPKDKAKITIRMLLCHSSGLPAWRPYYLKLMDYPLGIRKRVVIDWILKERLVFSPGKDALYSDLGFIILEEAIKRIIGVDMREFLMNIYSLLGIRDIFLGYSNRKIRKEEFAPTEFCPWRRRLIQGEVHDENAFSLGGYSGHAGLFGIAEDIFFIANILLEHYVGKREDIFKMKTVKEFFKKHNKRWALGWDTPADSCSSSGGLFSDNSIGHLGFTGTSIWIDLRKEIIIIFLTNRIHPSRKNERLKLFRPFIHDQIMQEIA
jgi:CubicO group peptidase (beta-lactamase class C family)